MIVQVYLLQSSMGERYLMGGMGGCTSVRSRKAREKRDQDCKIRARFRTRKSPRAEYSFQMSLMLKPSLEPKTDLILLHVRPIRKYNPIKSYR